MKSYNSKEVKLGKFEDDIHCPNVYKIGTIRTSLNNLIALLGPPLTDQPESYAEWLMVHQGVPLTIYDRAKLNRITYTQDEIILWMVGGNKESTDLYSKLQDAIDTGIPLEDLLEYQQQKEEEENAD